MRRLSASLMLVDTHDDPNNEIKAQGRADAQTIAPERETFTHSLADAYLREANLAFDRDETGFAVLIAERAHELLLEYEQLNPFEWDVQMLLAQVVSKLVTYGETQ